MRPLGILIVPLRLRSVGRYLHIKYRCSTSFPRRRCATCDYKYNRRHENLMVFAWSAVDGNFLSIELVTWSERGARVLHNAEWKEGRYLSWSWKRKRGTKHTVWKINKSTAKSATFKCSLLLNNGINKPCTTLNSCVENLPALLDVKDISTKRVRSIFPEVWNQYCKL